MLDSPVAPLFDVNVGGTDRNRDNVTVSIAGRERKDLGNIHGFSYLAIHLILLLNFTLLLIIYIIIYLT